MCGALFLSIDLVSMSLKCFLDPCFSFQIRARKEGDIMLTQRVYIQNWCDALGSERENNSVDNYASKTLKFGFC